MKALLTLLSLVLALSAFDKEQFKADIIGDLKVNTQAVKSYTDRNKYINTFTGFRVTTTSDNISSKQYLEAIAGIELTTSHDKVQPYALLEGQIGRYGEIDTAAGIGVRGFVNKNMNFGAELIRDSYNLSTVQTKKASRKFYMNMRF